MSIRNTRPTSQRDRGLTHISRRAAGRGHDAVVHHLRQAEVADHDLGVLVLAVVQDVLGLHRGGKEYAGEPFTHGRTAQSDISPAQSKFFNILFSKMSCCTKTRRKKI